MMDSPRSGVPFGAHNGFATADSRSALGSFVTTTVRRKETCSASIGDAENDENVARHANITNVRHSVLDEYKATHKFAAVSPARASRQQGTRIVVVDDAVSSSHRRTETTLDHASRRGPVGQRPTTTNGNGRHQLHGRDVDSSTGTEQRRQKLSFAGDDGGYPNYSVRRTRRHHKHHPQHQGYHNGSDHYRHTTDAAHQRITADDVPASIDPPTAHRAHRPSAASGYSATVAASSMEAAAAKSHPAFSAPAPPGLDFATTTTTTTSAAATGEKLEHRQRKTSAALAVAASKSAPPPGLPVSQWEADLVAAVSTLRGDSARTAPAVSNGGHTTSARAAAELPAVAEHGKLSRYTTTEVEARQALEEKVRHCRTSVLCVRTRVRYSSTLYTPSFGYSENA